MKKTLALLLTACLFLTACSSAPKDDLPAQRTQEFCTKLAALDFEGAVELIEPEQRDELDLTELGLDDPSIAPVLEAMKTFTTQNTVTVKDSKVEGDKAVVTVSVEYIDLTGKTEDLLNTAMTEATAQALLSDDIENLTEEDVMKMVCDALAAQATDQEWEKTTADYVVSLKKDGDDWFLVDAEEELLFALISNFGQ